MTLPKTVIAKPVGPTDLTDGFSSGPIKIIRVSVRSKLCTQCAPPVDAVNWDQTFRYPNIID